MLTHLLIFSCIEEDSCRSVQSCIGSLAWVSDDMAQSAHTSHLNTDKQSLAQDNNGKWVKYIFWSVLDHPIIKLISVQKIHV